MYVTVMPVSAFVALAFVWFYPTKLMMMTMMIIAKLLMIAVLGIYV